MGTEIVPFGKYKGQPVEILAADHGYCEWLMAQPWFSDKYRNVYNIVVNYGSEPQDSPEHNEMQAKFLNDDWCLSLTRLIFPKRTHGIENAQLYLDDDPYYRKFHHCTERKITPPKIVSRDFETSGWDVVYGTQPAGIEIHRVSLVPPLPSCICICDHSNCAISSSCKGGSETFSCEHYFCPSDNRGISDRHCNSDCYWRTLNTYERDWLQNKKHVYIDHYPGLILVELKPDLGDDYPSVLRQVKGYPYPSCNSEYHSRRCVVVRRFSSQYVAWQDVQKIFTASNIHLLSENSLTPSSHK